MRTSLEVIGIRILRYGLVLVLLWIGGMKFTDYEAEGIQPLVANSPLLSWTYSVMSVRAFSAALGVVEIALGLMIALRPAPPRIAAVGGFLAAGMFVTTLTFLLSTPGWHSTMGFPVLSVVPGQFLLKDIVLLGAAIYIAGEALGNASLRLAPQVRFSAKS